MAIKSRIISIQDTDDKANILIYGDSGLGKTVWCGTDDKVLFVAPEDNSDGLLSARLAGSTAEKWPVKTWDDLVEAFNYLADLDEIPYNWIAIDSLTEMQELAMRGILDAAVAENAERDPDIPQLQDWQKYYEMVKRMIKAFNALDVNVIYTALARQTEDEDGVEYLLPDLQGKKDQYAKKVASWMTSFGCLQMKRVKTGDDDNAKAKPVRRITFRDTGVVKGKDRTGSLAPYIDLIEVGNDESTGLTLKDVRLRIEKKKATQTATRSTTVARRTSSAKRTRAAQEAQEESAHA
jgi:hypothetical protein